MIGAHLRRLARPGALILLIAAASSSKAPICDQPAPAGAAR